MTFTSAETFAHHACMSCRPLAPPCPFVLAYLTGRLVELQEATLVSLMEMMALRSGHPSLGTPVTREEGLKRVLRHRRGAQFLNMLGNKAAFWVSPVPFLIPPHTYTPPLDSGAARFHSIVVFLRRLFSGPMPLRADSSSHPEF